MGPELLMRVFLDGMDSIFICVPIPDFDSRTSTLCQCDFILSNTGRVLAVAVSPPIPIFMGETIKLSPKHIHLRTAFQVL